MPLGSVSSSSPLLRFFHRRVIQLVNAFSGDGFDGMRRSGERNNGSNHIELRTFF
ncbi:hypothetical protein E1A91_A12G125700v1 [Gossypium mustelinum]|uniref:Uncharacterized protein n=1 Tax=Gossypium mustelinum TaxID=34275 RepID=A0A5D2WTM6_GOSMU|nr:hypothetical protein E1A91_A12G125700v1 [Gossypium mustelinum]